MVIDCPHCGENVHKPIVPDLVIHGGVGT
jgi:hypothetical protein